MFYGMKQYAKSKVLYETNLDRCLYRYASKRTVLLVAIFYIKWNYRPVLYLSIL